MDFTQQREEGESTGNKEEDKHTEELRNATSDVEESLPLIRSSTNCEIAPDGRSGNVFGIGAE